MKPIPSLQVLGKLTFQPTDPPLPLGTYVIQRVAPGTGNVTSDPERSLQIRLHVTPTDANSSAQQSRRTVFQNAVAAWHALTPMQKAAWRVRGKSRNLPGFNAYLSDALRAVPAAGPDPEPYTPPAALALELNLHTPAATLAPLALALAIPT